MTDITASGTPPLPQGNGALSSGEDGVDREAPAADTPAATEGWEAVALPGQMAWLEGTAPVPASYAADPSANEIGVSEIGVSEIGALLFDPASDDGLAPGDSTDGLNPKDLVQLVQDLNQCNDALLLRVSELEEALERSQVALQAEIERHQASPTGLPMELTPGPVQQQIAQLLSELDIANDGLRRTTIHNETLQAELDASQQRVAQLERECTLLQQRFSEKNTALHQAEETCRDLKARLHRQQRYTLQFKAALDKCLNMAPGSASPSLAAPAQQALAAVDEAVGSTLTMPRSQQILPWSAGNDAKTEPPSLTNLLRGLRGSPSPTAAPTAARPLQPEPPQPEPPQPQFLQSEPLQPEILPAPGAMPEAVVSPSPATAPALLSPDPWLEQMPQPEPIAPAATAPPSLFTEPSPWGEPAAPPTPAPRAAAPEPPLAPPAGPMAPAAPVAETSATPALPDYLNPGGKPSPSPLVYPLRSQKKIKSIAAVELPSFGRTVRRR